MDTFTLIYKTTQSFFNYLQYQFISQNEQKFKDKTKELVGLFKNIHYQPMTPLEKELFLQRNEPKLFKIYDILVGTQSKIYIDPPSIELRKAVDKFCNKLFGIKNVKKHFKYYPTRIFDEFIKGVTLFKGDSPSILSKPTYHREHSCGSAKIKSIEKFKIFPQDTPEIRRKKRKSLERCIIERKIYDQIYRNILHPQDVPHLFELSMLERIYLDIAKDEIRVIVEFKDDIIPYFVTIEFVNSGKKITYEKRLNGDVIVHKDSSLKNKFQIKSEPLPKIPQNTQIYTLRPLSLSSIQIPKTI
jgi:hypothetical protein